MKKLIEKGVEGIILGCTEIGLLIQKAPFGSFYRVAYLT